MALMGDQFPIAKKLPAFIRFKNNTSFNVEIIWINHDKKEKPFGVLAPNKYLDVNTYSSHPWIFKECITKTHMMVCGKEIFIGRAWIEEHKRLEFQHPINVPLRTMVLIEMPAMELRQLCLMKIATILKTTDDVATLELPTVLKNELSKMVLNKESSNML